MGKKRRLLDEYRFPGFRPRSAIQGIFSAPRARIIHLDRTEKKRHAAAAAACIGVTTTRQGGGYEIYPAEMPEYTWRWRFGGYGASGVEK